MLRQGRRLSTEEENVPSDRFPLREAFASHLTGDRLGRRELGGTGADTPRLPERLRGDI